MKAFYKNFFELNLINSHLLVCGKIYILNIQPLKLRQEIIMPLPLVAVPLAHAAVKTGIEKLTGNDKSDEKSQTEEKKNLPAATNATF